MAAGVAVVATAHGGSPEMVVQGETGLLIPPDNAEKAAKEIVSLAQNESLRMKMGESGRARVNVNFSKEAFRRRLGAIIHQL